MFDNEAFGWLWIHLGIVSGMLLGTSFLKPNFLGGYASPRRRLIRLGHISFIGLGALNLLFARAPLPYDASFHSADTAFVALIHSIASIAFIIAGVSMPIVCAAVAWKQSFFPLFIVPVTSALLATGIMAWEMLI